MKTFRLPSLALLGALALSLSTAACTTSTSLQTPPGFAVLEDQKEYAYRATSAEGVVIAVRSEANKPSGNLDFWADAVDRDLRNRGYSLDAEPTAVRSASGVAGRQARYLTDDQGHKYRFVTAVFVTKGRVWVVEAGGEEARVGKKTLDAIQKAIESLSVS